MIILQGPSSIIIILQSSIITAFDFPGIIPHDEIVDIFKNKSKQSKGKERVSGNIWDGDVEMA